MWAIVWSQLQVGCWSWEDDLGVLSISSRSKLDWARITLEKSSEKIPGPYIIGFSCCVVHFQMACSLDFHLTNRGVLHFFWFCCFLFGIGISVWHPTAVSSHCWVCYPSRVLTVMCVSQLWWRLSRNVNKQFSRFVCSSETDVSAEKIVWVIYRYTRLV